jgi:drug/metabolite transporter (DMT)-like permease
MSGTVEAMSEETRKSFLSPDDMKKYTTVAFYVFIWLIFSGGLILFNKAILTPGHFHYPMGLTSMHMSFGAVICFFLCRVFKVVPTLDMDAQTYLKCVVPVGAMFALSLTLTNSAYMHLSVAYNTMLNAMLPVVTFFLGLIFSLSEFRWAILLDLCVITVGVTVSSLGQHSLMSGKKTAIIGFVYGIAGVISSSMYNIVVQLLLQKRGLKMNPIQTLYYVAPMCFLFLLPPFFLFEFRNMVKDFQEHKIKVPYYLFPVNASVAFGLNMTMYNLIGKTSALTFNVAAVLRNWILIFLSSAIFGTHLDALNIVGYSIAFCGVMYYNWIKIQMDKEKKAQESEAEEKSLLSSSDQKGKYGGP